VHEDQDFKSGFWNLKIWIPAFFGKYWWNLYCIIWIILKDYIILYYQKLSLIIDYTHLSESKKKTHVEMIFYRLDLIRIITLFWGQLVREIKITFFENLHIKKILPTLNKAEKLKSLTLNSRKIICAWQKIYVRAIYMIW